jgi:hypothetical protein
MTSQVTKASSDLVCLTWTALHVTWAKQKHREERDAGNERVEDEKIREKP